MPYIYLVRNDYVLKTGMTRNDGEGKADKYLVYRRLATIGELFEKLYLTVTNIRDSGMLKMAKDLLDERGKLEKEEYHLICERFNIGKIRLNGELQYNYFPYKKTFLNVETIQRIYGWISRSPSYCSTSILSVTVTQSV